MRYRRPLSQVPEFRKKYGKRHYTKLVDRGLVVPAVRQLAKAWDCDYETAHKIIRESPVDNIHSERQTTKQAEAKNSTAEIGIRHVA